MLAFYPRSVVFMLIVVKCNRQVVDGIDLDCCFAKCAFMAISGDVIQVGDELVRGNSSICFFSGHTMRSSLVQIGNDQMSFRQVCGRIEIFREVQRRIIVYDVVNIWPKNKRFFLAH